MSIGGGNKFERRKRIQTNLVQPMNGGSVSQPSEQLQKASYCYVKRLDGGACGDL